MKPKKSAVSEVETTPFAIPATLIEQHLDGLAEYGIIPRKTTAKVGELVVDVYVFSCTETMDMSALLYGIYHVTKIDEGGELLNQPCMIEDKATLILTREEGFVTVERSEETEKNVLATDDDDGVLMTNILEHIVPILELFSRITGGTKVHLHAYMDGTGSFSDQAPSVPPSDDKIHIFVHRRPAGIADTENHFLFRCFDIPILENGEGVRIVNPTKSRGVLVKNKKGRALSQILNGNFYFLVPMFFNFYAKDTPRMFERLLCATWSAYCTSLTEKPSLLEYSQGAFTETVSKWITGKEKAVQKMLTKTEKKIHDHQKELATFMVEKKDCINFLKHSCAFVEKSLKRISSEYEKVKSLPGIQNIVAVEKGIQIETDPLIIQHGGVDIKIAESFTIHLEKGVLAIWTESTLHPQGIQHPHISENGDPCFGNATDAISLAVVEYRISDAVSYIMQWLQHGYTPELSLNPVEEWLDDTDYMYHKMMKEA